MFTSPLCFFRASGHFICPLLGLFVVLADFRILTIAPCLRYQLADFSPILNALYSAILFIVNNFFLKIYIVPFVNSSDYFLYYWSPAQKSHVYSLNFK